MERSFGAFARLGQTRPALGGAIRAQPYFGRYASIFLLIYKAGLEERRSGGRYLVFESMRGRRRGTTASVCALGRPEGLDKPTCLSYGDEISIPGTRLCNYASLSGGPIIE